MKFDKFLKYLIETGDLTLSDNHEDAERLHLVQEIKDYIADPEGRVPKSYATFLDIVADGDIGPFPLCGTYTTTSEPGFIIVNRKLRQRLQKLGTPIPEFLFEVTEDDDYSWCLDMSTFDGNECKIRAWIPKIKESEQASRLPDNTVYDSFAHFFVKEICEGLVENMPEVDLD